MILPKMYKSFSSIADNILKEDWRSLSKNDLLNLYIDNETDNNLREGYIAAIFCRYWNAINKYYQSSKGSVIVEDCFEWLTHAILYALEHRKWRDPESSLYNDPAGPDKALNICIASTRSIFYQSNNNNNRKINFGLESIERLEEENLSNILPADTSFESDFSNNLFLKDLVVQRFKKEKEIQGLIIDGIINGNVFENIDGNICFSKKKLVKHLRSLNNNCISYISKNYNVCQKKVAQACEEIKNMLSNKLYKIIDYTLMVLLKVFKETHSI